MAAVQHRATTRTSNTDNSTTKTKSKATSARKSPATKRKRVSAETARAAAALKGLAVEAPAPSIEANEPGQFGRINVMDITPAEERGIFPARVELGGLPAESRMFLSRCISRERSEDTLQRLLEKVNRVPLHEDFHFRVTNGQRAEVKRACTAKEYLCFPRPLRHKEVFCFTSVSPQQIQIYNLFLSC